MTHINPFNAELNPICHLLALLGAHHILHVSRIRVKIRPTFKLNTLYNNNCAVKDMLCDCSIFRIGSSGR
jgi:hypothetical protein